MPSRSPALRLVPALALALGACADQSTPTDPASARVAADSAATLGVARRPSASAADGRYLVVLRSGAAPAASARLASLVASGERPLSGAGAGVLVRRLEPADVDALRADAGVAYVEPVRATYAMQAPGESTASWALDRADQRARPLDGRYTSAGSSAGVRVYVFDTGIRLTHTEFGGRAVGGPDYIAGTGTVATDCHGHGTRAASDIGGRTLGIARDAQLVAVRVLDCSGRGTDLEVLRGLAYVRAQRAASPQVPMVVSMSLGVAGGSQAVDDAVAAAVADGIHVVVSAGNDNADACTQSPARAPGAVTVGASGNTDARAFFSNYGPCVDVYAPGQNVLGASTTTDASVVTWSGTSASAPYVAGAVAVWAAAHPTGTPAQAEAAVRANASMVFSTPSVGDRGLLYVTGLGAAAGTPATGTPATGTPTTGTPTTGTPTPTPANPAPVARLSVTCVRRSCTADGSKSTDDKAVKGYAWEPGAAVTGAVGAERSAKWTYAANGTYTVTLSARDAEGAVGVATASVTAVDRAPEVHAAASCTRTRCAFASTGSRDDSRIVSYSWNFGDSTSATGASATRVYARAGTYVARLSVTDDAGQTATAEVTARAVDAAPVAALAVSCKERVCRLDAGRSRDDGRIVSATWEPGDSSAARVTPNTLTTTVTYPRPGTYTARVTVTDDAGQTGTATVAVVIPDLVPRAVLAARCTGRVCTLDASRSTDDGRIVRVRWEPGDGSAATETEALSSSYTYARAGRFTVRVTVRDDTGQTGATTVAVTVP